MSTPIVPFPPLNDDGRDQSNGFTQVEDGGKFPNAAPIWGFSMYAQLPDVQNRPYSKGLESEPFDITPSDDDNLSNPVSKLYVAEAGDVHLLTDSGNEATLHNLAAGAIFSFTFTIVKIFDTGTHATGIMGIAA